MSDCIKELCKKYEENVVEPHSRSVGLFTIPEYPEFEEGRGMWSTALDTILTTLRYLAPATLLTLLWSQQSFIFKLLKYIDLALRALLFSSEEQKQAVLKWLSEYGPVRVDDLCTVWRQGWILCGVLDAALPGACAGHPRTSLSLKHAQALADHYLGVEPVFSHQELESNDTLSKHQEWRLTTYIDCIRHALTKVTPPITKSNPQKVFPEITQFTLNYIARGSGLTAAQIKKRMFFKIYPTTQQSIDPGDIRIHIKGPDNTYGLKMVPPILGKTQLIRYQFLDIQSQKKVTENVLPFAHGAAYLRNYGKNDMSKTYYIPKTKYDIDIEAETKSDHVRIGYTVNIEGKYEILITSNGQNIVGSPYIIQASKDIIGFMENESFCLEDGEEIDIVDVKSDRKVVLRIVDFVSEKMLLKENGVLERISEDEAKYLMENDINISNLENNKGCKYSKFNELATKVLKLNKVCKIFYDLRNEKKGMLEKEDLQLKNQQEIPDIVNSTLCEANVNPFILKNNRDKVIIPENISVSILTEKTELSEVDCNNTNTAINNSNGHSDIHLTEYKILPEISFEDNELTESSNPFLKEDFNQSNLNRIVTSEYETYKSQNEETQDSSLKIVVDVCVETQQMTQSNPFNDPDILKLGRPKSPVFKITTNDDTCQSDLICKDHISTDIKKNIDGEFVNPFFTRKHQHSNNYEQSLPVADFIIGAPVSLPPVIRSLSQETESFIVNKKAEECKVSSDNENVKTPVEHSSSLQANITNTNHDNAFESCLSITSNITDNSYEGNVSPKKEMWDSAYVSIDENNTSPDNNNNDDSNESKEILNKQKYLNYHNLSLNIGPAEREIWQNCEELKENKSRKTHDEITKLNKRELKKSMFTPIIEESITCISSGMKGIKSETVKYIETDPVTSVFTEINNIYDNYFPTSEKRSIKNGNRNFENFEANHVLEYKDKYVKSASEDTSDVMRHKQQLEGEISEVQIHVAESVSVSQTLHVDELENDKCKKNKDQIKFGDSNFTNIVLEKKKYWDERIRQIEAKAAEETRTQQKKRRLSAKQLRHNDSLSKRRGKQIVKKYLNANEGIQKQSKISESQQDVTINHDHKISTEHEEDEIDNKRVRNWKDYWDNKLKCENNENQISCFKTTAKSQNLITKTDTEGEIKLASNTDFNNMQPSSIPGKQEIPEEVFKAFETSPRRFFGTSRKQILSKIDNFSGKPNAVEEPLIDNDTTTYESGLVSSRISLFHNISKTEKSSLCQRKSQSMHNLYQHKDSESEKNNTPDIEISTVIIDIGEKENSSEVLQEKHQKHKTEPVNNITLKEKRARMTDKFYTKSFDETNYHRLIEDNFPHQDSYVQRTIKFINRQQPHHSKHYSDNVRKLSSTKSEMDIFNKLTNNSNEDDFNKHKSYDDLPKVCVKNFISLYEDVSKISTTNSIRNSYDKNPKISEKHFKPASSVSGTATTDKSIETCVNFKQNTTPHNSIDNDNSEYKKNPMSNKKNLQNPETLRKTIDESTSQDIRKESSYISLSDIDLEIVEKGSVKSIEQSPEGDIEIDPNDYKSRFEMAKQYFQSLEELREIKKPNKLNECELLLYNKSTESLIENNNKETKRVKKKIKSHTMPSSEISEYLNQLKEQQNETHDSKFIKISEKFHVDDLFTDVMEGRFSRQGSFRGIPHKKAVLEAFRSMENISDNRLSPYELAVSQLSDFANENKIKNAQTYLSEYPYLPTTDPSKYHSRLDVNASGLISFKELLKSKVRRNSVPDLRLNPSFTVDL